METTLTPSGLEFRCYSDFDRSAIGANVRKIPVRGESQTSGISHPRPRKERSDAATLRDAIPLPQSGMTVQNL